MTQLETEGRRWVSRTELAEIHEVIADREMEVSLKALEVGRKAAKPGPHFEKSDDALDHAIDHYERAKHIREGIRYAQGLGLPKGWFNQS